MPARDKPSQAKAFYQRFLASADRLAFLRGLVNSTPLTFETEWLEFKPYPFLDSEKTVKEVWSKTVSAFANTEGGVLVWGIGAKKVNRVDAARKFQLVTDPDELRSRLYELHHQASDPPLSGVEIEPVRDPNEGGKGFVVCFIPQGVFVPYRAEYSNNQYYIRVGDDSIVPRPAILRRLFYPQSLARIEMSVVLSNHEKLMSNTPVLEWSYMVILINSGNNTAHSLYIHICDNVRLRNRNTMSFYPDSLWNQRKVPLMKSV